MRLRSCKSIVSSIFLFSLCSQSLAQVSNQTTEVDLKVNLPVSETVLSADNFNPDVSSTYNHKTAFSVYDSAGTLHSQTFYFIKVASNEWLVSTSVNGVMVDFQSGAGSDLQEVTSNSVGIGSSIRGNIGYTAGRLTFNTDGSLANITAGDDTVPALSKLETEALGAEIVSANAASGQQIKLDFNIGNPALASTQFDDAFTVWRREQDGSSGKPVTISIEHMDEQALDGATPVAINNNSEVVLNNSNEGYYRAADGSVTKLAGLGSLQIRANDINDAGVILGDNVSDTNYLHYWENKDGQLQRVFTYPYKVTAEKINNQKVAIAVIDTNVNVGGDNVVGVVDLDNIGLTLAEEDVLDTATFTVPSGSTIVVRGVNASVSGIANDGSYFGRYTANVHRTSSTTCDHSFNQTNTYFSDVAEIYNGGYPTGNDSFSNGDKLALSYVYSTPSGDQILYAFPGQQRGDEDTFCQIKYEDDVCKVTGATFQSVGEPNRACKFNVFNTNIGFGELDSVALGEIPFVLVGMTDPALDDLPIGVNHNNLQPLSDVLSRGAANWTVTRIVDINEKNEAVGQGKYNDGPVVPIKISANFGNVLSILSVEQTTIVGELRIDWSGMPGADRYEIFNVTDGLTDTPIASIDAPTTTHTEGGLSGLTSFRVRSCNAMGCSELSEPVSGIPLQDSDGDGLSDSDEVNVYGTDPNNSDTDGDGLDDGIEVNTHGTNPNAADEDGDGLNDNEEIALGTLTDNADTDGDGLDDGTEVKHGFDPLVADTDGDGIDDLTEYNNGLVWVPIKVGGITIFIQVYVAP